MKHLVFYCVGQIGVVLERILLIENAFLRGEVLLIVDHLKVVVLILIVNVV